ncbi:hypothetical protein NEF87_003828 [Candidatus Lokiarchaeum ossiferum]|uniref:NIF system FeS cluster assembly NifU N-terminal domain-containing protein n=1 Tax=Candidatus Lokiarchaeum ossiferum TaxID=2951803 RepID=A0ABY6HVJ3_9ARCH|nr:hypothetical protein NEF87_003828 [Candidatus Lokiarchaeum sp. B-35]
MDEFDDLVNDLQNQVNQKDQADFSPYALSLAQNPYHNMKLDPEPDVYIHEWQGPCGDSVCWYLKIVDNFIQEAYFSTNGCMTAIIASSQTAKMVHHQYIADVRKLTHEQVLHALGKFPEADHHCITLALNSLNLTLNLYCKTL